MDKKIAEIEFGCGGKMVDGFPCTSLGSAPCLCGECIQLLPSKIEALIANEQAERVCKRCFKPRDASVNPCPSCGYGADPQPRSDWSQKVVEKPQMPLIEHSPLPWRACNDGKCSCKQIWCSDYPIAVVNSGDWGDDYPSIRLVGETSLDLKAEAYMEQCTYGHIPEELAEANIQFIVKSCNSYDPAHDSAIRREFAEKVCLELALDVWHIIRIKAMAEGKE